MCFLYCYVFNCPLLVDFAVFSIFCIINISVPNILYKMTFCFSLHCFNCEINLSFIWLLSFVFLLGGISIHVLAHFSVGLCFLLIVFKGPFYIKEMRPLYICTSSIFFLVYRLPLNLFVVFSHNLPYLFIFLTVSLEEQI